MTTEHEQFMALINKYITKHEDEKIIHPNWIANAVMMELDPKRRSPPLVYAGAHMHLRQLARGRLRKYFESGEEDSGQHKLFPDLQWRYPTAQSKNMEEPEYILTEDMSDEDIDYNIARLRGEAEAKLKHADALETYKRRRRRQRARQ